MILLFSSVNAFLQFFSIPINGAEWGIDKYGLALFYTKTYERGNTKPLGRITEDIF
jgi:hypothetical protein